MQANSKEIVREDESRLILKMELIAQGAEAKLYRDGDVLVKDRIKKRYRINEIDDRIRGFRTRREAKIIGRLGFAGVAVPKLIECDDKEKIKMEYLAGERISDVLEKKDYRKVCFEIGKKVAAMHNHNVMHGDTTTSNMILKDDIVYFIDFGLSFVSHKVEDMAVDLKLLRQALESKHYTIWEECFKEALAGYKEDAKCADDVIKRLEVVEGRGRYKGKRKAE